jgi:hydroxyacylglutathione hydrolase
MQVTEHVHALRVDYEIRMSPTIRVKRFVYVYFIVGQRVYLIDTGIASSVGVIETYLTKMGRSLDDVATVVLTHGHADHMGGLKTIQSRSGCRVVAHALETPWIENTGLQVAKRPSLGFDQLVSGDVTVDQQVADGDKVQLEPGLELEVIHTPGHSQGSVCYLLNGHEVLVTGDALAFAWGIPVYDDAMVSLASVKRLGLLKPVACLLSSWDTHRFEAEASSVFNQCQDYLQTIHEAIRAEVEDPRLIDPMVLCQAVLSRLKLPAVAANPLVASSLMSHVPYLDQAVLQAE